jgi:uncharacterized protein (DUF58 family)
MNRLSYRLYRFVSAMRYHLPRRFTPAGLLALTALLASGAIGIDMEQTMAFQGFAFVLCLLTVSMGVAPFFRGRFTAQRVLPRFGSVGQPFTYQVVVQNRGARNFPDLELLEELSDPRPTLAEFIESQTIHRGLRAITVRRAKPPPVPTPAKSPPSTGNPAGKEKTRGLSRTARFLRNCRGKFQFRFVPLPSINPRTASVAPVRLPGLPSKGSAETRVEVLPLRRGPLRFTRMVVAKADPFGLFRGFVRLPLPQTVLILPKRYLLPDLDLPGRQRYQQGGVAMALGIGNSDEFVSLRDYRPGDPLRHIHWRTWARTGRPIVKEFQDEHFVRHALILDTFVAAENSKAGASFEEFPSNHSDRAAAFEEAVSVAASFACTVGTQESLLDLLFVGPQAVCFTTGRGLGQAEQALEILASIGACREQPFTALQELVKRHTAAVCGCVCILLAWDEPRRELVRQLRARGLPILVLVVVEAGAAGRIQVDAEERPEHFQVLEVGKVAEGLQELEFL